MKQLQRAKVYVLALAAVLWVAAGGCGRSPKDNTPTATPPAPKVAASQLQQAFGVANPEVKKTAEVASEAMRTADYEKAIQSLQAIRARSDLTLDQGMAVYNSERALEAKLIAGIAAGDPNAQRAYDLLKKSRRN